MDTDPALEYLSRELYSLIYGREYIGEHFVQAVANGRACRDVDPRAHHAVSAASEILRRLRELAE